MNEIHLRVEEEAPIQMDGGEARIIEAISPTATVTPIAGGYILTITDLNGTTTATLHDGVALSLRQNNDGTYTLMGI